MFKIIHICVVMSQTSARIEVSFKLTVNSFQYKLLEKDLGPSPWRLTTKKYEGELLLGLMLLHSKNFKKTSQNLRVKKRAENTYENCKNLTTVGHKSINVYEVVIPEYYWENYAIKGFQVDAVTALLLHAENKFKNALFAYLDSRRNLYLKNVKVAEVHIAKSMREFCNKFSISDDDMTFDALIKSYQRSRVARNELINQRVKK